MDAVKRGSANAIEIFLDRGIDPDYQNGIPLQIVLHHEFINGIKILLERGATITKIHMTECMYYAIYTENKSEHYRIFKLLMKYFKETTHDYHWLLHFCVTSNLYKYARLVLRYMINDDHINKLPDSRTALISYIVHNRFCSGIGLFLNKCINFHSFFIFDKNFLEYVTILSTTDKDGSHTTTESAKRLFNRAKSLQYTKIKDQYIKPIYDYLPNGYVSGDESVSEYSNKTEMPESRFYKSDTFYVFAFKIYQSHKYVNRNIKTCCIICKQSKETVMLVHRDKELCIITHCDMIFYPGTYGKNEVIPEHKFQRGETCFDILETIESVYMETIQALQ